ncbi:MAG: peptidoglycan DD-metalloendopeptidase family protein [Gammaproteobacteria bacterium]
MIALTAGMAVRARLMPDADPPDSLERQKATTETIDASFRAPAPTVRSLEAPITLRNDTDLPHGNGVVDTDDVDEWHEIIVRPHDALSAIFERLNFDHRQLHQLLEADQAGELGRLRPKETLKFHIRDGELMDLVSEAEPARRFHARKQHGEFKLKSAHEEPASCVFATSARITNSLWQTAQAAGLSEKMVMELVKLFAWDIDFALDIRKGDSFAVIFEQYRNGGVQIGDASILAAEFVNQNTRYRAVRFKDDTGHEEYYTEEGKSPRKAFLRTPVNFVRISSYFNLKRKHPILNRIRAHRGVDYAAPQGTPVKATGDGKVVFVGVNGGYGKTLVLQHGEEYSTLYAHLSRFAGGIRRGKTIRQGELIGLVGHTGLATGPHLHYEFRVNGVHQNPLTAKLPKTVPLSRAQLAAFKSHTAPVLAKLDEIAGGLAKGRSSTTQELTDRRLLAMTAERAPTSFSR